MDNQFNGKSHVYQEAFHAHNALVGLLNESSRDPQAHAKIVEICVGLLPTFTSVVIQLCSEYPNELDPAERIQFHDTIEQLLNHAQQNSSIEVIENAQEAMALLDSA